VTLRSPRAFRAAASLRAVALGGLAVLAQVSPAAAKPSVWDLVKNPKLGAAEQLLIVAERSRTPAEDDSDDASLPPTATAEELNRQLNARAAALITIADGHQLGDPRLLYLLGDALVKADKSYLPEGRLRLQQALERDPDSPLAADAWFSLATAEGKLGRREAERAAYSRALALEWQPEAQAMFASNRAESSMASGDLRMAIDDYRLALSLARSGVTRALALWGLAVASERDGDLPTALGLAREAAGFRFGPPTRFVLALDLPNVYFEPEYEEHYYRALAEMAEADALTRPEEARSKLQTASLLWSLYLENARRSHDRWLPNAELLRQICQRKLARIDAQQDAARAKSAAGAKRGAP
jgi:tetratricopeptide (TPR) repeat protein